MGMAENVLRMKLERLEYRGTGEVFMSFSEALVSICNRCTHFERKRHGMISWLPFMQNP